MHYHLSRQKVRVPRKPFTLAARPAIGASYEACPFRASAPARKVLRQLGACTSQGSPRRTGPAIEKIRSPANNHQFGPRIPASLKWSWRRDLNPRPSDYKSDALPAELRQPFPPGNALKTKTNARNESRRRVRTHSRSARSTAQKSRLAHPGERSKPPPAGRTPLARLKVPEFPSLQHKKAAKMGTGHFKLGFKPFCWEP